MESNIETTELAAAIKARFFPNLRRDLTAANLLSVDEVRELSDAVFAVIPATAYEIIGILMYHWLNRGAVSPDEEEAFMTFLIFFDGDVLPSIKQETFASLSTQQVELIYQWLLAVSTWPKIRVFGLHESTLEYWKEIQQRRRNSFG